MRARVCGCMCVCARPRGGGDLSPYLMHMEAIIKATKTLIPA